MSGELDPQHTEISAERQATEVISNLLRENPLPEAPKEDHVMPEQWLDHRFKIVALLLLVWFLDIYEQMD